ncbi:flagellin-like protein [Novosphingobium nitrogenifigens DSM 19370]|uniref:Flagellin n=1 Tax=Novosphingobium nitrogenifigens DSM 19370 TaxID=983920 RepID=F1Z7N5_9SPHN|nr:flagellin [Novosphingobium nitrogenifigens]EGD59426.1 flagellin-like protein [Novosphingobium nitrogenifigens DSM 19370]
MTVINTNISAIQAANASNSAASMTSTAMQRLSTGKRINSAADDAAGLAITNSMTSQINGMQQGVSNANDGISLAQTAGGALNEVTNMLQRVRQLAVQSSSGTYQNSDRTSMQSEVTNLTQQISDILNNTTFNGNKVFNVAAGTATSADDKSFTIQTGANATDTVAIVSKAFSSSNLFDATDTSYNSAAATQALDVSTQANATTTLTNVDNALAEVNATQATLGAGQNRLTSVVNNLNDNITNLSSARSRIQDTDYSATTTQLAKAQILSQASSAMIAQANQSQQNVLSLLK